MRTEVCEWCGGSRIKRKVAYKNKDGESVVRFTCRCGAEWFDTER